MKTKFTPMLTGIIAVIILGISTQKSLAADSLEVTELENVKNIRTITVSGNVDLYISQGATEKTTIYDKYYSENALVQVENGELRISSYVKERLKVEVTVALLNRIIAHGDVIIQSSNQINSKDLSIDLNDSSIALLDASVTDLQIIADDSSSLKMSGDSQNYNLEISGTGKADMTNFATQNKSTKIVDKAQLLINNNGKNETILAAEKFSI